MEPDEIIMPPSSTSDIDIEEMVRSLTQKGPAAMQALRIEPEQALALLAIGAVGGAIGTRLLKGALGITVGIAGAAWAYHVLTSKKQGSILDGGV